MLTNQFKIWSRATVKTTWYKYGCYGNWKRQTRTCVDIIERKNKLYDLETINLFLVYTLADRLLLATQVLSCTDS